MIASVESQSIAAILPPGHPYVRLSEVCVTGPFKGSCKVKWRDFSGMKQDAYFDAKSDAFAFANKLESEAQIVRNWHLDGRTFDECDALWRTLDGGPK